MGKKRIRGEGVLWEEKKETITASVTPTGRDGLDALAQNMRLSRSEFLERIGRGLLEVHPSKQNNSQ